MDLGDIARYSDLEKMIADPGLDMIDVCLPPSWHADVAVAALRAGKHVFCEKPIALTPSDADRMVERRQLGRRRDCWPSDTCSPSSPSTGLLMRRSRAASTARCWAGISSGSSRTHYGFPTSTIRRLPGGP